MAAAVAAATSPKRHGKDTGAGTGLNLFVPSAAIAVFPHLTPVSTLDKPADAHHLGLASSTGGGGYAGTDVASPDSVAGPGGSSGGGGGAAGALPALRTRRTLDRAFAAAATDSAEKAVRYDMLDADITKALIEELAAVEDPTAAESVYSTDLLTLTWDDAAPKTPYTLTPKEYFSLAQTHLSAIPYYYGGMLDIHAKTIAKALEGRLTPGQKTALEKCQRSMGFTAPIDEIDFTAFDEIYRDFGQPGQALALHDPPINMNGFYKPFGEEKPLALAESGGKIIVTSGTNEQLFIDFARGENYFDNRGRRCIGEGSEFMTAWFHDAFAVVPEEQRKRELVRLIANYPQEMQNAGLLPLTSLPMFTFTHPTYIEGVSSFQKKMRLHRLATGDYEFTFAQHVFDVSSSMEPADPNSVDYWVTQSFKETTLASDEIRFELTGFSIGGHDAEVIFIFFRKNLQLIEKNSSSTGLLLDEKLKALLANQLLLHLAIKKRTQLLQKLFPRPEGTFRTDASKKALKEHRKLAKLISLYYFLPPDDIPEEKRTTYAIKLTAPILQIALKIQESLEILPMSATILNRFIEVAYAIETIPAVTVFPHDIRVEFGKIFLSLCQEAAEVIPASYLAYTLIAFQDAYIPLSSQLSQLKSAVKLYFKIGVPVPSDQFFNMFKFIQTLEIPEAQHKQCIQLCLMVYRNTPRAEINLLKFILAIHQENLGPKLTEMAYTLTEYFNLAESKRLETALENLYCNGSQMTKPGSIEYTLYQAFKRKEAEGIWAAITFASPVRDPVFLDTLRILSTHAKRPAVMPITTTTPVRRVLTDTTPSTGYTNTAI